MALRKRTIAYRYDDTDRRNLRYAEVALRIDGHWSVICGSPGVNPYRTDIYDDLASAQQCAKYWVRGGRMGLDTPETLTVRCQNCEYRQGSACHYRVEKKTRSAPAPCVQIRYCPFEKE